MKNATPRQKNAPYAHPRQYRILPASDVGECWDDVPDAVIVELVRSYTRNGDAVLFGTSKSGEVGAIRVYRGREPYSTYFRKAHEVGEAVERMYRMRPVRKATPQGCGVGEAEVQGLATSSLPFHPAFSATEYARLRQKEQTRVNAWNYMIEQACKRFDDLYKSAK